MSNLAIVTGGSRGIGFAVAEQLLEKKWDVHLVSSNEARLAQAAAELTRRHRSSRVSWQVIDFSDLVQVRKGASLLPTGWDALINNAGVKVVESAPVTAQGHEWHLGINQLAPFALTLAALPLANRGARVTTVSSIVARISAPADLLAENLSVSDFYSRSKLMNLAFAIELHERLRSSSNDIFRTMSSTAAHPGFTRASKYGKAYVRPAEYLFAQSSALGAAPIVLAATSESGDLFDYLGPRFFELWGNPAPATIPDRAADLAFRRKIWHLSKELSGNSDEFLV
jgi:NAD(P)-dependent dehydrogenase (short-subunit alcohol dehydrogenase family)